MVLFGRNFNFHHKCIQYLPFLRRTFALNEIGRALSCGSGPDGRVSGVTEDNASSSGAGGGRHTGEVRVGAASVCERMRARARGW